MSPDPSFQLCAFQVPKAGESAASCQDAWMATSLGGAQRGPLRFALSDGASTTSEAALWARILVQAATAGIAPWARATYRAAKLAALRALWRREAQASLPEPAPWYAEAALDRGAFATLLRVQIYRGTWEAEAWGDSCLFHLRSGELLQMLPDMTPADFELAPCLLGSVPGHDGPLRSRLVQGRGSLRPQDRLILASDALACWIRSTPDPGAALGVAATLSGQEAFAHWVAGLRASQGLKNDDTTLLVATFR